MRRIALFAVVAALAVAGSASAATMRSAGRSLSRVSALTRYQTPGFTYQVETFYGGVARNPTGLPFDAATTAITAVSVNGKRMFPYGVNTLYIRTYAGDQTLVQIVFPPSLGVATMTGVTSLPAAAISVTFS